VEFAFGRSTAPHRTAPHHRRRKRMRPGSSKRAHVATVIVIHRMQNQYQYQSQPCVNCTSTAKRHTLQPRFSLAEDPSLASRGGVKMKSNGGVGF